MRPALWGARTAEPSRDSIMSTTPQPVAPSPPAPSHEPDEVRVLSHSNIYYWWPVWAVGFILGLWTWFGDGHLMVTVPPESVALHADSVTYESKGKTITEKSKDLILPADLPDKER